MVSSHLHSHWRRGSEKAEGFGARGRLSPSKKLKLTNYTRYVIQS